MLELKKKKLAIVYTNKNASSRWFARATLIGIASVKE